MTAKHNHDFFVCHASEDKASFVNDLVRALEVRGLRVWYDSQEIALGDDFRRRMEQGLLGSRFGLVVISPTFLEATKHWPQQELSALLNLEAVDGQTRIIPVLYEVDWKTLTARSPFLATRSAIDAAQGPDAIATKLEARLQAAPALAARSGSPLYAVPHSSQTFVGRLDELTRLQAELEKSTHVRVCAAVEGLPGVGKTELVLQLAHQLAAAGRFPGGVFWFAAESPDLEMAWASEAIAGRLGITEGSVAERARAVINLLSRKDARVLVILDNVERWSEKDRPRPLPDGVHVTLLATTNKHNLGGSRFRSFPLGILKPDEARALLASVAGDGVTARPGFDALLEHIDGHALALELAGAYLREYPEVTPAEYVKRLEEGRDPEAKVADQARYERTANQAFELLWKRLDERTRKLWQIAACFAPVAVSRELADACGIDGDARADLRRFMLIELDGQGRFRMHRQTRRYGQSAGEEAARGEAVAAFLAGMQARARLIDLSAGFRIYTPDRAHFDEAILLAARKPSPVLSELCDRVGTALQSLGELRAARAHFERALAQELEGQGEAHPAVARGRSNLAMVLQAQGDVAGARVLLEQALSSALRNLGEDHPDVATCRSNLATVLKAQGDVAGARVLLEQALSSDLRNHAEDHPNVTRCRSNLATVLQAQGDFAGARALLEQALSSDLRNHAEDHPDLARRRSNLALVLQDQGDFAGARVLLEQALASDLRNYGEAHPDVARCRSNLAVVLKAQGDLVGARVLLEKALSSALGNHDEAHPDVARCRSNLAVVLQAQGDLAGARALLEQALSSTLRNYGEAHPDVPICRSNLAVILRARGDLTGARVLLEQALSSALRSHGEAHRDVAICRSNLATVLQAQGDLAAARALLEQALSSDLRNLGEDHPDVALRRSNLALVLQAQGELAGARVLHEQALSSDLRNHGEDHPVVAVRRYNLAGVAEEEGDLVVAVALLELVLRSEMKSLGLEHPSVAMTRAKLASLLHETGEVERARVEAREALRVVASHSPASFYRAQVELMILELT